MNARENHSEAAAGHFEDLPDVNQRQADDERQARMAARRQGAARLRQPNHRAGQKMLTLQGMPREPDIKRTPCDDSNGFRLHAAVCCEAQDRQSLAQLCRYITRPALAYERVQTAAVGQLVLELKTPWRDGTTHLVMSPLEFMARMAALAHRPRLHLIRFHGVLARATASGRPIHDGECRHRVGTAS